MGKLRAHAPKSHARSKTHKPKGGGAGQVGTCKAWAVTNAATGAVVACQNQDLRVQIASLTKVMTFVLVMEAVHSEPELLKEYIIVSKESAAIRGTSAKLQVGEVYTVLQLLYGMMLPSGNDAASALAEYLGDSYEPAAASERFKAAPLHPEGHNHPWSKFVAEMNRQAIKLNMTSTTFGNPHGLQHTRLRSTAHDVSILVRYAMSFELFREVVNTVKYSCQAKALPDKLSRTSTRSYPHPVVWKNSNKLLGKTITLAGCSPSHFKVQGVKTGITRAAGGCLATWIAPVESGDEFKQSSAGSEGKLGDAGIDTAEDARATDTEDSSGDDAGEEESDSHEESKAPTAGYYVVVLGALNAQQRFDDTVKVINKILGGKLKIKKSHPHRKRHGRKSRRR